MKNPSLIEDRDPYKNVSFGPEPNLLRASSGEICEPERLFPVTETVGTENRMEGTENRRFNAPSF